MRHPAKLSNILAHFEDFRYTWTWADYSYSFIWQRIWWFYEKLQKIYKWTLFAIGYWKYCPNRLSIRFKKESDWWNHTAKINSHRKNLFYNKYNNSNDK